MIKTKWKSIIAIWISVFLFMSFFMMFSGCQALFENSESTGTDEPEEKSSVFYLLGNDKVEGQMMGCVVQTMGGKTIVIDGGSEDALAKRQLMDFLSENANGHVDAWFFTHPHHDHIGAFHGIFSKIAGITVDKIYHNFPSLDELETYGYRNAGEMKIWKETADIFENKFAGKVQIVQPKDVFVVDEIKITVLRVYDPTMTTNFVNNSSVVYRIENDHKSFLILGDLGVQGGAELMKNCSLELLQTDYTQMAHHGQGGVNQEFYAYIKPKRCIWPTPDWLWDNDNGGGFDTGPWQTVRTREWMEELGVTEHWVAKDGTQGIKF